MSNYKGRYGNKDNNTYIQLFKKNAIKFDYSKDFTMVENELFYSHLY